SQSTFQRKSILIVSCYMFWAGRLCHGLVSEISQHVPQPCNTVFRPLRRPAAQMRVFILYGTVSCGKSVWSVGVYMSFEGNPVFCQSRYEGQGVLNRNHTVIPGCKDKTGAGAAVHRRYHIRC